MMQIENSQLEAICEILGDTHNGFTKTELKRLLEISAIECLDDGSRQVSDGTYSIGLKKSKWLFNCLASKIKATKSTDCLALLIENAFSPALHIQDDKRNRYHYLQEGVNKILLLAGYRVKKDGKIVVEKKASTLDEVDERVNSLKRKLYNRAIHAEVLRFCEKDYLRKDYYDTVFEATKSLAERVRSLTGLDGDGSDLFQKAFSLQSPCLFFNSISTDSERSEHKGLRELLEAIFHLVRNPAAHTPKINWKADEERALDILAVISFAHRYLDNCHKMPSSK